MHRISKEHSFVLKINAVYIINSKYIVYIINNKYIITKSLNHKQYSAEYALFM